MASDVLERQQRTASDELVQHLARVPAVHDTRWVGDGRHVDAGDLTFQYSDLVRRRRRGHREHWLVC